MNTTPTKLINKYRVKLKGTDAYCALDYRFDHRGTLLPNADRENAHVFGRTSDATHAMDRTAHTRELANASVCFDFKPFDDLRFDGTLEIEPFTVEVPV